MNNYVTFRTDRRVRRGGGVCIWAKTNLKPSLVCTTSPAPAFVDVAFVHVACAPFSAICCGLYVPPGLCKADHSILIDFLSQEFDGFLASHPSVKLVVTGDFNDFNTDFLSEQFCLTNTVTAPTRNNAILDHIWIDEELRTLYITPAAVGPPLKNSDHNCILLSPSKRHSNEFRRPTLVWDYRSSNIAEYIRRLSSTDFSETLDATSVDDKCEKFYETLIWPLSAIPCELVYFSTKDKPWVTPVLKLLINKRWDAFRQKKWALYKHFKAKVVVELKKAKLAWRRKNSDSPRGMWRVVNSIRGALQKDPWHALLAQHGGMDGLLDALTTEFSNNFNSSPDVDLLPLFDDGWDISVSPESVFFHASRLSSRKAMGPDRFPSRLFNVGAQFLCVPLANLFNSSLSARCFPSFFKRAHVCPIPKSASATVSDFRPISLLSPLSKLFEKLVLAHVRPDLVACFGVNQHAYRPAGSTVTALVELSEHISKALDSRGTTAVNVFCLDLSRAFDKLQHHRLINHLNSRGLNHGFLLWLLSYLRSRTMRVQIMNVLGPTVPVYSGVPQGSVLGPSLFTAYMGSIDFSGNKTQCVKYADDITIVETMQHNRPSCLQIDDFERTFASNGLLLNKSKSKLCIRRSQVYPPSSISGFTQVDSLKILGVYVTNNFKWNESLAMNLKTASRRLHIIRCLKDTLSMGEIRQIYHALISSVFLYASPVYGRLPKFLITKLERFQKRAHRLICGPSCDCSHFPPMTTKLESAAIKLLLRSETCSYHPLHRFVPRRLRASGKFCVPTCATDRRLNSFFPWACLLHNY